MFMVSCYMSENMIVHDFDAERDNLKESTVGDSM